MFNSRYGLIDGLFNSVNIEILDHGLFYGDSRWRHDDVHSPFNRLYFVLDGDGELITPTGALPLLPGNMVLVPVGTTNSYRCQRRIVKFYIHFKTEIYFGRDVFSLMGAAVSLPCDAAGLSPILGALEREEVSALLALKGYLYGRLHEILCRYPPDPDRSLACLYKYHDVYQFVKQRCSFRLSQERIAEELKLPGLAADFRQDTGRSLQEYVHSMIVERARERLLTTDLTVKQIAYQMEFTDEFYFSRFFKKRVGLSPREYRRRNRIV